MAGREPADGGQRNTDASARIRRRRNPERHRNRNVCGKQQNQGAVFGIDLESGQSGDSTAQFFGTGKENRVVALVAIGDGYQKICGHEIGLELGSERNLQAAHIAECYRAVDRMSRF